MIGRDQSTSTATGVGLIVACAAIGLMGCSGSEDARDGAGPEKTRAAPNIVLIVIDTLRADKLGCYGYPASTSAPIDALAARGVRFERVISQCSWTRPSIGSILTSRYQSQIMVPLILYGPSAGIPEGRVVEQRVRLLDLMPTLLDFAGVEGPAQMEGISLMPAVRGEASNLPLPEFFVVETARNFRHKLGVYSRDWKYFENRVFAAGLPGRSLHAVGTAENGAKTSVLDQHPEVGTQLA
jgi:arylsulfatase A-like enzyme